MTDGSSSSPHKEARLTVFCRISAAYLPGPHRGVPCFGPYSKYVQNIIGEMDWVTQGPTIIHALLIISGSGGISQDIAD